MGPGTLRRMFGARESSPSPSSGVSTTCWCPDLWPEVAEGAAGAEAGCGMRLGYGPGALPNTPAFLGLRTARSKHSGPTHLWEAVSPSPVGPEPALGVSMGRGGAFHSLAACCFYLASCRDETCPHYDLGATPKETPLSLYVGCLASGKHSPWAHKYG